MGYQQRYNEVNALESFGRDKLYSFLTTAWRRLHVDLYITNKIYFILQSLIFPNIAL